jgi:hypothetical protein
MGSILAADGRIPPFFQQIVNFKPTLRLDS